MKLKWKRIAVFLTTLTFVFSLVLPSFSVLARLSEEDSKAWADEWAPGKEYFYYPERGENQPYTHGYTPFNILDWSPETDPNGEYLRARIPLQQRNDKFTQTQANPNLTAEAELFVLAGDYQNGANDMWLAGYLTPYNSYFGRYAFNFWQYMDYYGVWHGQYTQDVPEEMLDIKSNPIMATFEVGVMSLPNPAYTNAAHKNGSKSIAVIAPENNDKKGQLVEFLLQQDENGNFPAAEKLIQMKEYYGYDGYFVNQEASIYAKDIAPYKLFMKQMMDAGVYIQWYDAIHKDNGRVSYQNEFTSVNAPFVKDEVLGQVSDSVWLNYWWNKTKIDNSKNYAEALGLDPLKAVFTGIEGGLYRWNQPYDIAFNKDENGQPKTSLAIIGADMPNDFGDCIKLNFDSSSDYRDKHNNEDQWKLVERERIWWSGPSQDPTNTGRLNPPLDRPDLGIKARGRGSKWNSGSSTSNWDGLADQLIEKSVINGTNFFTNFNTGHGLKYYVDGKLSNDHEWNNIIIQDILPTWQWWVDSDGEELAVDFDYGPTWNAGPYYNYASVNPYQGGSSLVVSGDMDEDNYLHLYKTDLDVNANSNISISYLKSSQDDVEMQLGLIFKDEPEKTVYVDVPDSKVKTADYVTKTIDLSAYSGREIASLGFNFTSDSAVTDYQMNIGEIKVTDDSISTPDAPTGLKIDKAYDNGEMKISWDMKQYSDVKQYNVYAVVNGQEMFMGGTYDEVFYIKDIYDTTGEVTIKLRAVGADGTESAAAEAKHDYSKAAKNVKVLAADGFLSVTWTGGQADVSVTTAYEKEARTWTASGKNFAVVPVPSGAEADGARYTMKITTAAGGVTTYDDRLDDSYAAPYNGKVSTSGSTTRNVQLPSNMTDYRKMHYSIDGGAERTVVLTGRSTLPSLSVNQKNITIVMEDYNGNKSAPVTVGNAVTVKVATEGTGAMQPGKTRQFTAEVTNDSDNKGVVWRIFNNLDSNTVISSDGLLTLGSNETSRTIKVVAESKADFMAHALVSLELANITITPSDVTVKTGGTQKFTAEVINTAGKVDNGGVIWRISGNESELTTIDENGLLTVSTKENASQILVTAVSKTYPNLSTSSVVTVKPITTLLESFLDKALALKEAGALDNVIEAVEIEFNAAVADAQALLNNSEANQQQVNDATKRLIDIIGKVDWKKGDKAALEILISTADEIDLSKYFPAGQDAFNSALAEAKTTMSDNNAMQDDVDDAIEKLIDAITQLRLKPDKTALNDLINKANQIKLDQFTSESGAMLKTALVKANAVALDENAGEAQVLAAKNTLQNAVDGLVKLSNPVTPGEEDNNTTNPPVTGQPAGISFAILLVASLFILLIISKTKTRNII